MAVDAAGNLYIADPDNHRIRKVDASGTITTVAGNGTAGFAGDGGAATAASLSNPRGVAVDAAGNLYIADQRQPPHPQGGCGRDDHDGGRQRHGWVRGDGGAATAAQPRQSLLAWRWTRRGTCTSRIPNNHRIRKVDAGGTITTVAGNGVRGFAGDGGAATAASLG